MNWLGGGLRTMLAALLGCVVGAILFIILRRHALDLPPVVGVLAGLATASVSRERSGPRGIVVGALALWATAVAEVLGWPNKGLFRDVVDFHERLGWLRFVAYAIDAVVAVMLAGRAFARPRQSERHVVR